MAINEEDKKNIHKTIFNDKFSMITSTKGSDYALNFVKPDKTDYRKKRNQTYYPNYDGSSVKKDDTSEYNDTFTNFKREKEKKFGSSH